jgi:hypothetical protein
MVKLEKPSDAVGMFIGKDKDFETVEEVKDNLKDFVSLVSTIVHGGVFTRDVRPDRIVVIYDNDTGEILEAELR